MLLYLYYAMQRQQSLEFVSKAEYEPLESIADLVSFTDKLGSTAAHYCAQIGLPKALKALLTAGASKWRLNKMSPQQYPAGAQASLQPDRLIPPSTPTSIPMHPV